MKKTLKNIKVSDDHHKMLKDHCDKNGLKIYRVVEKWIEKTCKVHSAESNNKGRGLYEE